MLNDSYVEQALKAKPGNDFYVKLAISIWVIFMGIPVLFFIGGIGIILSIIGICLFVHFLGYRNMEYEYTLTNGSIEIAAIYNASKRKELMHFEMEQVTMVTPEDSDRISHELVVKRHNFTSGNKDRRGIALIVEINGKKELVLMEPSAKSLEHIKGFAKNKIYDI